MLQIASLADRPDLVPICAAWNHAEWGEFSGSTLEQTVKAFNDISREDDGRWRELPSGTNNPPVLPF